MMKVLLLLIFLSLTGCETKTDDEGMSSWERDQYEQEMEKEFLEKEASRMRKSLKDYDKLMKNKWRPMDRQKMQKFRWKLKNM